MTDIVAAAGRLGDRHGEGFDGYIGFDQPGKVHLSPFTASSQGKTHLAIAIARACIRDGARGRFFNVADLVHKLEAEGRAGRQGRMADYLPRKDFIILDEFGYLPFARSGRQLLFRLISRLYEQTSITVTTTSPSESGPPSSTVRASSHLDPSLQSVAPPRYPRPRQAPWRVEATLEQYGSGMWDPS